MRYGVIRTLSSTGGVITAAGLIFAASVGGLLFSSIGIVVQGGFVIAVGILLDTFVVRTVTVPAIASMLGRANWWPSRPYAVAAAGPATAPDVCETTRQTKSDNDFEQPDSTSKTDEK
jgi:putative drug exporter of the RND superfamily